MANLRLLGRPNLFRLRSATVTAGSEYSPSYAAANILTTDASQVWRSLDVSPVKAGVILHWQSGSRFSGASINALGLVGHNLWDRSGQVRFICTNNIAFDVDLGLEELAPNGSSDAVNTSDDHADIQGTFSAPSSGEVGPDTTGSPWEITLQYPTPSANPRADAVNDLHCGLQLLALWVEVSADCEPYDAPTIALEFTGIGSLGEKSVTQAAGQWLFVPFHATILANADGSGVALKISATVGSGGAYCKVKKAFWFCESTQVTGNAAVLYDSRWLPAGTGSAWAAVEAAISPYQQPGIPSHRNLYHSIGSTIEDVKFVYVLFREDHVPYIDGLTEIVNAIQPPGYVECGHVLGGIDFSPTINRAQGPYISYRDLSSKGRTDGLATFGQRLSTVRNGLLKLDNLTIAEANWLELNILSKGILEPVLLTLNPGALTDPRADAQLGTLFCSLRDAETSVDHRNTDTYKRSMTLAVEEF